MRWWSDLLFYLPSADTSCIYIWGPGGNGEYLSARDIVAKARAACAHPRGAEGKQE
jgi:hypothetical protein